MTKTAHQGTLRPHVVIVGAGIGGLAAACRLAHIGADVTVVERHDAPGGKMRVVASPAGPVDAGPTVLTLKPVLEDLFAALGESLDDHLSLKRLPLIARHFWPDGSRLDLWDDAQKNLAAIHAFAGAGAARQFAEFSARARALFEGLDGPMMQTASPTPLSLAMHCLSRPKLVAAMGPLSTLAKSLTSQFDDPRLAQLFGRYATYVGGSPYNVPSLLSLIWQAEVAGVWAVQGGMHRLAQGLAKLAEARGARFHYNNHVARIVTNSDGVSGVTLACGAQLSADHVVFNGDPRALSVGALGAEVSQVAPQTRDAARSLSADVWAFAARAAGPELSYHNVFFRADPKPEFDALANGRRVPDPTLYVCAMDRGGPEPPPNVERFEIIANAPPLPAHEPEVTECKKRCFHTLAGFGLTFDPIPDGLTTPREFDRLFPASQGSLYGQSPHGLMAAFRRPTAKTKIPGLYLAGGGTHPGAGVPMALLSARHAVETMLSDRTLRWPSRPTVTRGGMSTGSAPTAAAPSVSSRS
ncbi:1-hydroxycarotenoid 3,4-desaturase CrtD [Lutimaribacter marinistellae]|uniref:1-hydroxycarotenoid 3,4-desaturase CrtD n=1 Tax=Lutimaribacter marinistellae TaxID=1820329 RepID=A0ABV7TF68_9RHOB